MQELSRRCVHKRETSLRIRSRCRSSLVDLRARSTRYRYWTCSTYVRKERHARVQCHRDRCDHTACDRCVSHERTLLNVTVGMQIIRVWLPEARGVDLGMGSTVSDPAEHGSEWTEEEFTAESGEPKQA